MIPDQDILGAFVAQPMALSTVSQIYRFGLDSVVTCIVLVHYIGKGRYQSFGRRKLSNQTSFRTRWLDRGEIILLQLYRA